MNDSLYKKKIADLVEVFNNIRIPLSANQRAKLQKIYPYYGAQGIVDYVDNFLFDGEYLLVAEDGENLRSNNQNICNLVKGKFWVNNHAHILRANKENDIKYLYYNFNRIKFEPYVTGSSQPKLNKENLLNIVTSVHLLKEQQKIASVLSALDDKIELNNRINAELEAMAKTLYDYWFVQFDFPNSPPLEGWQNSKNFDGVVGYKSSGGKMVYNETLKREIPEGWEVKRLEEIEEKIITGKTPSTKIAEYFNGNIPFITIDDIRKQFYIFNAERNLTISGAESQVNKYVYSGDICVSCIGTIGIIGIVATTSQTNQQINTISQIKDYNRYFLLNSLKNYFEYNVGAKKGAVLDNMNKQEFSNIPILDANKHLKELYFDKVNPLYEKIKLNLKQNQELSALRDWLLPMLMNGQVKVG